MPRRGKGTTQSGAPAQPIQAPKGQTYGEGERALESQRRMPVPDFAQGGMPAAGGPSAPAAGGPTDMADLQQALAQMVGQGSVLKSPTERPDEPVTQPLQGSRAMQRPMPNEGLYELRAIARRYPYRDLLAFLDRVERGS